MLFALDALDNLCTKSKKITAIFSKLFEEDLANNVTKFCFDEVDAEANNMHRTWIKLIHELAIMEEDFNVTFDKREYI